MIVCQCERVSDRRINRCIGGGCHTLPDLIEATGAGSGCGGCIPSLEHLLASHLPTDQRMATAHAAS